MEEAPPPPRRLRVIDEVALQLRGDLSQIRVVRGACLRISRTRRRHGGFELAFGRWALAALVIALALAACAPSGGASADGDVRSIEVSMSDELRFEPADFTVSAGETIRFEVTNDGQAVHEFLIGDEAVQDEFAEEMAEDGGHHETDAGVTVQPGETESFEYIFDVAGELLAGCHEPGHYEAGMVASISVGE